MMTKPHPHQGIAKKQLFLNYWTSFHCMHKNSSSGKKTTNKATDKKSN
jgi:hypothetical protein